MQQLVRDVAFAAPEAADALVHVPDEETLAGEPAIRADARPVLEQIVLPGSSGDGGDLDDARHALDRRQRNAHRRALDRLHVDPAESELRPRAHLRWMLAALDPGPLPHEAPHADPLLGKAAGGIELGETEEMAELVTEDAEGDEM